MTGAVSKVTAPWGMADFSHLKKDSGSARQGETANTETCNYPNRLNLSPLTAAISGAFEKILPFLAKFGDSGSLTVPAPFGRPSGF